MNKVFHELSPIFDEESRVLILGSMPSFASREAGFYYGHKQNRFWKILGDIYQTTFSTKEEKITFLHKNHIALWDVIASCEIDGSKDSSIQNVICNDIDALIKKTKIHTVFSTGKKATELYNKYIFPQTKIKSIYLPSPSPANQTVKYDALIEAYKQIESRTIIQ